MHCAAPPRAKALQNCTSSAQACTFGAAVPVEFGWLAGIKMRRGSSAALGADGIRMHIFMDRAHGSFDRALQQQQQQHTAKLGGRQSTLRELRSQRVHTLHRAQSPKFGARACFLSEANWRSTAKRRLRLANGIAVVLNGTPVPVLLFVWDLALKIAAKPRRMTHCQHCRSIGKASGLDAERRSAAVMRAGRWMGATRQGNSRSTRHSAARLRMRFLKSPDRHEQRACHSTRRHAWPAQPPPPTTILKFGEARAPAKLRCQGPCDPETTAGEQSWSG